MKLEKPPSNRVNDKLKTKGYLETALSHVQLPNIGTKAFLEFKKKKIIHLTDEFVLFNFYSDKLKPKQVQKIFDKVHNEKEIKTKFDLYGQYPPSPIKIK